MTEASSDPTAQAAVLQAIGSAVVTASHVEGGLARALLWATGQPCEMTRKINRMGWSQLVEELQRLAEKGASPDAAEVAALLATHDIERLNYTRNEIIHGRMDLSLAPSWSAVRHPVKGRPHIVAGTLDDLIDFEADLRAFSRALEATLPATHRRVRHPVGS